MDWAALLDKYGYPTLLLALGAWFFLKEVWPLFKTFLGSILEKLTGILKQLETMTAAVDKMTAALAKVSEKQEDAVRSTIESSLRIIDEIRRVNDARK